MLLLLINFFLLFFCLLFRIRLPFAQPAIMINGFCFVYYVHYIQSSALHSAHLLLLQKNGVIESANAARDRRNKIEKMQTNVKKTVWKQYELVFVCTVARKWQKEKHVYEWRMFSLLQYIKLANGDG